MTPEELSAFGVNQEEAEEIGAWIRRRTACVVGADGLGGSGVFVRLEDGHLAVLTARHVVVACILTGEITVARIDKAGSRSIEPIKISIDNRTDSALLLVDEGVLPGEALAFPEWTSEAVEVSKGMPVISTGAVGEWKDINHDSREIRLTKVLGFWTGVVEPKNTSVMIVCDIDETNGELPKSFRGMSGGPLFSVARKFAGINTTEERYPGGPNSGRLAITPAFSLLALYTPFRPAEDAPKDYIRQGAAYSFLAVNKEDKKTVRTLLGVDFFWSSGSPEATDGQIARIDTIQFFHLPGSERYLVNMEAIFRWYDLNNEENRLAALQEELVFFLTRIGFESVREIAAR